MKVVQNSLQMAPEIGEKKVGCDVCGTAYIVEGNADCRVTVGYRNGNYQHGARSLWERFIDASYTVKYTRSYYHIYSSRCPICLGLWTEIHRGPVFHTEELEATGSNTGGWM